MSHWPRGHVFEKMWLFLVSAGHHATCLSELNQSVFVWYVRTGNKAVILSLSPPVVFPQDLLEKGLEASNFAMLGLGDIVIPGIFIALLLRFDVR